MFLPKGRKGLGGNKGGHGAVINHPSGNDPKPLFTATLEVVLISSLTIYHVVWPKPYGSSKGAIIVSPSRKSLHPLLLAHDCESCPWHKQQGENCLPL